MIQNFTTKKISIKKFHQNLFTRPNRSLLLGPLSSTQPSFRHERGTAFQPQKCVISTHKTPQFNTPVSSTHQYNTKGALLFRPKNSSVQHKKASVQHARLFNTLISSTQKNWQVCGTYVFCVERKGVLNWRFFVLSWRILGTEKQWSLCWLRGTPQVVPKLGIWLPRDFCPISKRPTDLCHMGYPGIRVPGLLYIYIFRLFRYESIRRRSIRQQIAQRGPKIRPVFSKT